MPKTQTVPLTPETIRDLLETRLGLAPKKLDVLDHGKHRVAAVVDEDLMVLIPREPQEQMKLRLESRILRFLNPHVTLRVPNMRYVNGSPRFVWYEKIPGEAVTHTLYKKLSDKNRGKLAKDLAYFIHELHTVNLRVIRAFGLRSRKTFLTPFAIRERVKEHLSPRAARLEEQFFEAFVKLRIPKSDFVFGHFDLHSQNLAFDVKARRLNGVFDFGTMNIADRHLDFASFFNIDLDLTKRVVKEYESLTGFPIDLNRVYLYTTAILLTRLSLRLKNSDAPEKIEKALKDLDLWTHLLAKAKFLGEHTVADATV